MSLNESDFPEHYKSCGIFDVYTSKDNYLQTYCYLKAQSEVNDNIISEKIIRKMVDLQLYLYLPVTHTQWFTVRAKRTKIRGLNRFVRDHFVLINADPKKVVDWLSNHVSDMPVATNKTELKSDKLSVGPCAFPAPEHVSNKQLRFVKVRFDGVSVPFYFDKTNGQWDQQTTRQEIIKTSGKTATDSIMAILSSHMSIILGRSKDRLLNISGIPEYGEARILFFEGLDYRSPIHQALYAIKGDTVYKEITDDKVKLANPLCKPIPVFRFGYQWFTTVNDKIYKVPGFRNREYNNTYKTGTKEPIIYRDEIETWKGPEACFDFKTLISVPVEDEYVREKVIRAMKSKL